MRVLVFGDSIVYGAWDSRGGWADRLKQRLHQQFNESQSAKKVQLLNLGIGGDSSASILKRLRPEIEARYSVNWPLVLVFSFCINDERTNNGMLETPTDVFRENVYEIIKIAQQYSDKILFCGVPPLRDPVMQFKGLEYSDQRIKDYEATMQHIISESRLQFISIRLAYKMQKDRASLFSFDGVHPSDAGHELIANLVYPELERLLIK